MKDIACCPICSHNQGWDIPFFDQNVSLFTYRSTGYRWRACLNCGSGYPSVKANLEELQRYWDINRIEGVSEEGAEAIFRTRFEYSVAWADRTWNFASPHLNSKKQSFLDIACGLGATVKKFQDMGLDAYGVDADPNTQASHINLGIDCQIGQFENVRLDKKFDLISIAHAIYFVTDPRLFIRRVKSSLSENGLFMVIISDLTSAWNSGGPSQITTWYPTPRSLANALCLEGFGLIDKKRVSGSILMIFSKESGSNELHGAFSSAFSLRFYRLRYRLFGRPIVWIVRAIKRKLKK